MELRHDGGDWHATIVNGPERTSATSVEWNGSALTITLEVYDAGIRAAPSEKGRRLDGEFWCRLGRDRWRRLPFHATAGASSRFSAPAGESRPVDGRWTVQFERRPHPSVAIFETTTDGEVWGTFLNMTGDYRFLDGSFDGQRLRLSRFDGAHMFLFDATLRPDGTLAGRFWGGEYLEDRWSARRDPQAQLPDTFAQYTWSGPLDLASLRFPDTEGHMRSVADIAKTNKVLVIEILGTWCPNCQDAGACLDDLYRRYRSDGLAIVGLSFEMAGDYERDLKQLRNYARAHDIGYPLLLASGEGGVGPAELFPQIQGTFVFPTVIFARGDGTIQAINMGFSGPATGIDHLELRARFEELVLRLLNEP